MHGFVCDLAEQSRALEAEFMNAVLGLKEFVCDLAWRQSLVYECSAGTEIVKSDFLWIYCMIF